MPDSRSSGEFIAALQALSEWFDAERVPYTLIGGVAVSLIAVARATQDIDTLIWLEDSQWEQFLLAGEARGFIPRIADALEFAREARVLLCRHGSSGVDIDISFGALEFEREMVERATRLSIETITLRVPTPEDLIVTKAVAHRARDLADIESILSARPNLDLQRIRYWIGEFARALDKPELQEEVALLLKQKLAP